MKTELGKFYGLIDEIKVTMMTPRRLMAIWNRAPWPTRNGPMAPTCGL